MFVVIKRMIKRAHIFTLLFILIFTIQSLAATSSDKLSEVNSKYLNSNQFAFFHKGAGGVDYMTNPVVNGSSKITKSGNVTTIESNVYVTGNQTSSNQGGLAVIRALVLTFDGNTLNNFVTAFRGSNYFEFNNDKFAVYVGRTGEKTSCGFMYDYINVNRSGYSFRVSTSMGGSDYSDWDTMSKANTWTITDLPSNCTGIYVFPLTIKIDNDNHYTAYYAGFDTLRNAGKFQVSTGYNVSYNANGGTPAPSAQNDVTSVTLPSVSRTGYTFNGWYNVSTKVGNAGATYNPTADVTLTANWTANNYTISYNGNGGTASTTSQTKAYDSTLGTLPTASRTGYTFNGWYTAASGGSKISTSTKVTGNATYYAHWTANNYTISYNGSGGTASTTSQTKAYDSTLGTLPTGTRAGYNFNGWYTAKTGGSKISTSTKVAGNATYYAQWTARTDTKYKVEHYQMNVNGSGYTLKDTDNLNGTTDTKVTPSVKTYTGFTAPSTQTVNIDGDGTRVVKYYYTRNKYNFTLGSDTGVSTSGSTVTGSYYYGSTITLKATPANGYKWDKWSDGNTNQNVTFTMPANAVSRTPEVHPITYTITYKLNGGKVDYMKTSYNVETPTFYIDNPTKKGFTFTGWTGTGINSAETDLTVPLGSYGNKTFTATWGEGVYTISFDGNENTSGSMETLTVKSGESITLPENGFVKDGYKFVGWYTTKHDAFGKFYKNGATISDLTESITLRAQWKLIRGNNPTDDGPGNDDGNGNNPGGNTGDNGGNGGNTGNTGDNGGDNGGNTGDNGDIGGNTGDNGANDDNGGNGGNTGDNGDNGGNNGGNGNNGKKVVTSEDEIGYFGTAERRNEISIRTTIGIQDKKLTLNYNY